MVKYNYIEFIIGLVAFGFVSFFSVDFGSVWLSWIWFGLVWLSMFVKVWFGLLCFGLFEFKILHSKGHGQTCTKIETYKKEKKKKKKENRMTYRVAAQLKIYMYFSILKKEKRRDKSPALSTTFSF